MYITKSREHQQTGLEGLKPVLSENEPHNSFANQALEFIQTLVVFLAIGSMIYLVAIQPHKVSGCSMCPTFSDGDFILTDKVTYRFQDPKRGDIVVFKYPRNTTIDYIKRIIAIPGDTVKLENGKVYVNNQMLDEPYIHDKPTFSGDFLQEGEEITVPNKNVVVFGDNRTGSSDSRMWGEVPYSLIIGKAFFRYWPPNSVGTVTHYDIP